MKQHKPKLIIQQKKSFFLIIYSYNWHTQDNFYHKTFNKSLMMDCMVLKIKYCPLFIFYLKGQSKEFNYTIKNCL